MVVGRCSNIYIDIRVYFNHFFGLKKYTCFCHVSLIRKNMYSAICDFALYLQSTGLNISWIMFWYNSILVLKNDICNAVSNTAISWKRIYFSKVLFSEVNPDKINFIFVSFLKFIFIQKRKPRHTSTIVMYLN